MSLGVCFKNCNSSKLAHLLDAASKFDVRVKVEKLIKKQTCTKTETNSLLNISANCYQNSKTIPIILSYMVSKLVRFWRHSV